MTVLIAIIITTTTCFACVISRFSSSQRGKYSNYAHLQLRKLRLEVNCPKTHSSLVVLDQGKPGYLALGNGTKMPPDANIDKQEYRRKTTLKYYPTFPVFYHTPVC